MTRIYLVELFILLSEREDRSLLDWLNKAHEHAKSIGPTRFNPNYSKGEREPIKPNEYKAIIDKHISQLESQKDVIERIKALRDKSIAHLDNDRSSF
jgi:hypothetical protein